MTEENNNQPATPPINYEEHLDWFRIFVFIILPIQFITNIYGFYQYIRDFNQYSIYHVLLLFFVSIFSSISIGIVFFSSIKQKPIGYKVFWIYSIFIIIYRTLGFIIIYFYSIKQYNPFLASEYISNYLLADIITTLIYIITAIINLIYFSHRKFLFGIPDEKSIPPESKEEE